MTHPIRHAAAAALFVALSVALSAPSSPAAPLDAAAARALLAERETKPSVHAEPAEIDAALQAAGLTDDQRERLWAAVTAAVLPGAGSRLDGFLFLTRDPEWRPLRGRFAEYLEIPAAEISPAAIRELHAYPGVISLSGLDRLSPDLLAALDGFGGEDWGTAIEFPALTTLSPEAAAGLARTKCLLVLPALESLAPAAARALAGHEGVGIVLGGLDRLDPEAAAALAGITSLQGLLLPDLEVLDSTPLAARLAKQDHVFLPRVRSLSPEIAQALAPNGGGELTLTGLENLPADVAKILGGSSFFGITLAATLAPQPAAELVGHNGPLVLAGTRPPSLETAAALARHPGEIRLPGIVSLPANVAAALAPHEGLLACDLLADLPVDTARALARHRGGLWLGGLQKIGPEAARLLASCPATLSLPSLAEASPRALEALLAKQDVELPPQEAITLVPEPDGSRDDFPQP